MFAELVMPTHKLSWLFPVTFLLALLIVLGAYVIQGVREKYPLPKVLLTLSGCVFFFILGSKLGTFDKESWNYILTSFQFSHTEQKSALTGYPMMFLGAFLVAHWLKFNPLRLDKSGLVVPIALFVQQFGCLFAGCCAGYVSYLPWSIRYDSGSIPYSFQVLDGHCLSAGAVSLPVHPVPLYIAGLLAIAFIILLKTYRRFSTPGTIRFFAIFLYLICRFIGEFFRDVSNHHFGGEFSWGLKVVQWEILAAIMVFGTFIFLWERVWKHSPWETRSYQPDLWRTLTFLSFLFILYSYFLPSLDIAEKVILQLLLFSSLISVVVLLYFEFKKTVQRSLSFTLAIAGFLCLGQSYRDADLQKGLYHDINVSGSFGHYYHNIRKVIDYSSSGCGSGPVYSPYYRSKRTFSQGTFGYSLIGVGSKHRQNILDLGLTIGSENDDVVDTSIHRSFSTYKFSAAYRYEAKGFGFVLGNHIGSFYYPGLKTNAETVGEIDDDLRAVNYIPQIGVRIGSLKTFYVRSSFGSSYRFSHPLGYYSFGMGTGFNNNSWPSLEIGYALSSYYVSSEWAFTDSWRAQASYFTKRSSGLYEPQGMSLGLSYRIKGK